MGFSESHAAPATKREDFMVSLRSKTKKAKFMKKRMVDCQPVQPSQNENRMSKFQGYKIDHPQLQEYLANTCPDLVNDSIGVSHVCNMQVEEQTKIVLGNLNSDDLSNEDYTLMLFMLKGYIQGQGDEYLDYLI